MPESNEPIEVAEPTEPAPAPRFAKSKQPKALTIIDHLASTGTGATKIAMAKACAAKSPTLRGLEFVAALRAWRTADGRAISSVTCDKAEALCYE